MVLYNMHKGACGFLWKPKKLEGERIPMIENIIISGFADEIDPQLDVQLKVVKDLGMEYICLRAADGKGIAEYSVEEFQ